MEMQIADFVPLLLLALFIVFATFRNPRDDVPAEAGFYTGASSRLGAMLSFQKVA